MWYDKRVDIAIIGASGDCGRQIAGQLIAARLLAPTERLQLVGRKGGKSERFLYGLISDITDAYAEHVPDLEVALSPKDVVADLWVIAAGQTIPTEGAPIRREDLAKANAVMFADYAEALAANGQGTEVVIVASNPVELGVALFARAIGRERVIGIGAHQDSLRLRREIASDLGVRRQRVGGFLIGEHGDLQTPIWSSVSVHGIVGDELAQSLRHIRRGTGNTPFAELVRAARESISPWLKERQYAEAFEFLESLSPDVRVLLKPFVTQLTGAKTCIATANATIDMVRILLDGREAVVAGQAMLEAGDFYGLTGPLGVPLSVSHSGITRIVEIPLSASEESQVRSISAQVTSKVNRWIGELDNPSQTARGEAE